MRYQHAKMRLKDGVRYKGTVHYKEIREKDSDVYVITQFGDRLDTLAYEYYGNPQLWWFIAKANKLVTMNVPVGTSLRIPVNTTDAIVR
tara:strand:- start:403 stop:669 length:267 start_codon:yes stop_codon:yes gene_type:complete